MRFFHRCRTFWQQKGGFGAIEAALMLPIFLMFTFAVIDLGNLMLKKQAAASAARTIANAIQTNPAISSVDLTRVINSALSNLTGKNGYEADQTAWMLWSSTTPPNLGTKPTFEQLWMEGHNKGGVARSTTVPRNPWLDDNTPSNDNNPYYIGVHVWRNVPWLTPLPRLVGISTTFSTGQSSIDPDLAPYGRKAEIRAYELVTLNYNNSEGERTSPFEKIDLYTLDSKHEETTQSVYADYCVISRIKSYTFEFHDANDVRCEIRKNSYDNARGMTYWDLKSQANDIDAGQNDARCEFLCFTFKPLNYASGEPAMTVTSAPAPLPTSQDTTKENDFGGVYTENLAPSPTCLRSNPRTNACSCPPGTTKYMISEFTGGGTPGSATYTDQYYCPGYAGEGVTCGYKSWVCL